MSSSWLQAERGFFPVKELRFLVEIQGVKSSGGNPGCAGLLALGVLMKKEKIKALKLSTGSGHFSQNINLVGGLMVMVLPIKTGRYHCFVPRLDLRVPGKRRPCPSPPVAEILILMVRGCQRLSVAFPKCLGN